MSLRVAEARYRVFGSFLKKVLLRLKAVKRGLPKSVRKPIGTAMQELVDAKSFRQFELNWANPHVRKRMLCLKIELESADHLPGCMICLCG